MVACAPNRSQGLCQEHLPPSSPHDNFGAGDPPSHPRMGTLLHPDLCPCRIWKLRCSRIGDPAVYGDFGALQMAQSPHMATSVQPGGASKLLYVARYLPSLHRGFYTWQVGPRARTEVAICGRATTRPAPELPYAAKWPSRPYRSPMPGHMPARRNRRRVSRGLTLCDSQPPRYGHVSHRIWGNLSDSDRCLKREQIR